jgi:AraC family transcriptional activator of pyochelin receptor
MSITNQRSVVRLSWKDLIDGSRERNPENGSPSDPLNRFFTVDQDDLMRGKFEGYRLRSGLGISILDFYVHRDIEIVKQVIGPEAGFGIVLEGSSVSSYTDEMGRVHNYTAGTGTNGARSSDDSRTWNLKLSGGQTHTMIRLDLDKQRVPELMVGCETEMSLPLRRILFSSSGSSRDAARKTITPSLEFLVRQALQCPYRGATRRLFMEGKALEIFAWELEEFSESPSNRSTAKTALDVEKLYAARRILEEEFEEPPSLPELAHRIGTNDFKLKRGFREVFGITVFDYVRKLRLEKARSLLEGGDLSVTEVALAVGYGHFGHFASVFKKAFGVLPSHYRRPRGTNTPLGR